MLRNDKERREYIADPKNWKVTNSMPGIRLLELKYGDRCWYKLQIWMTRDSFDFDNRKPSTVTEWADVRIMEYLSRTNAYSYGVSPTQIANVMKEIDKKERRK